MCALQFRTQDLGVMLWWKTRQSHEPEDVEGLTIAVHKIWEKTRMQVRRPVSRVLSSPCGDGWPFLWDVRYRTPRATDPGGGAETPLPVARHAAPIWSCSRWGLPCRFRCRSRGGLLPHRFTLACWFAAQERASAAVCFLWHFPWGRPRRPLAGTVSPWSPDFPHPLRSAAIQPSDPGPS